jgi:uncharacterized sulfatase
MEEKITRRNLIKKGIAAGVAIGAGTLIGTCTYKLLKTPDIADLYGNYPPSEKLKKLAINNANAIRPNVIIIYCDDLGYGDIGCYGNSVIRTPNIDSLAREGNKFTDFYACAAVCAPSRAGLLTGRYPFRTGIIGNPFPKNEPLGRKLARNFGMMLRGLGSMDLRDDVVARGLASEEVTIAEALKLAGYKTGMVGKWHLGDYSTQPEFNPLRHGFDFYYGVPHSNDMRPCPVYKNETKVIDNIHGEDQSFLTGTYTKEALQFIESCGNNPFFLYFAHTFPHQPLWASEKFDKKSLAGKYGDAVEEIDWSVGQILQLLKKKGIDEKTIIIFTSDNGPWFEGSADNLRGRKGQSNEGGFKVPFIVRWKGTIPAGKVTRQPAMNIDLFPTLLALAGVGLPQDRIIDGKNILGLLKGDDKPVHEDLYFYHYDLLVGMRWGKWKYYSKIDRYVWPIPLDSTDLANKLGKDQLGYRWPLLYNLEKDPGEAYNVIDTYPDIAKKLAQKLETWEKETMKNPRGFIY